LAFLDGIIIGILEDCIMKTQVLNQQEIDQLLSPITLDKVEPIEPAPSFREAFYAILKRALFFTEKVRYIEFDEIEKSLDREKIDNRDIFEYGMQFVVDGTDTSYIDKILSNIIKQEKGEQQIVLKTIQKEAVLAVQDSFHPYKLYKLLNSYTDIPLNDPEFNKMTDESAERIHAWHENFCEKPSFSLETLISGFQKSELVIISSTPGRGKTLLALTMAKYLETGNDAIVFISLKESENALGIRLSKINLLPSNNLDLTIEPDFIYTPRLNFLKLEKLIRKEYDKKSIKAVFVDYLELLSGGNTEYALWITTLKALSKELNILIVVVLQIPESKECSPSSVESMISSSDALKCIDTLILINGTDIQDRVLDVYKDPGTLDYWGVSNRVKWRLT